VPFICRRGANYGPLAGREEALHHLIGFVDWTDAFDVDAEVAAEGKGVEGDPLRMREIELKLRPGNRLSQRRLAVLTVGKLHAVRCNTQVVTQEQSQ
jgi:hypothetical protein